MNTILLIAGATAIFAVGLLALTMLVSHQGSGGATANPALFKTGNPDLHGSSSTLGLHEGAVHPPATLEFARTRDAPEPTS
jgi:hypothetical protein